jgi:hypothetical protein
MRSTADKLVADYLGRLDRELAGLPRSRRRELVEEISAHIAEARTGIEPDDELGTRQLLERLGDPEEIAAEAVGRYGGEPAPNRWKEIAALILLPIGGVLLPVIGWFIGLVLLWVSDAWNTRDKLVGTLLFPGGLLIPVALGVLGEESSSCGTFVTPALSPQPADSACPPTDGTAAWEIALVVLLVVVPLLTSIYLARRLRRPAAYKAS